MFIFFMALCTSFFMDRRVSAQIIPHFPTTLDVAMSGKNPLLIFGYLRGNNCCCFVYYVSKVLENGELRYSKIEKLIFSLIVAARKLRPYF
ncbi:protein SRG1 [Gossypium australe]|uniref:Protein SRG1 n=1 Tax=Gossypium australe TaxID=47621 RepID=A0A5B6X0U8_9ROSI|nr:protein SRG1 [Gossypium australe]